MNAVVLRPCALLLALNLCNPWAWAQEMRDPTVAPGTQAAMPGLAPDATEGMTVLVREGKPYLVVGTRLYAVGDSVGTMRVERITEAEVWLHDGRTLIKAPRFTGIVRTAVPSQPACTTEARPAPVAGDKPVSRKAPPATSKARSAPAPSPEPSGPVPCEDTQP